MPICGLPEPHALPKESEVSFDADGLQTWKLLLAAEQAALTAEQSIGSRYHMNLVAIRVLGFFMLDFWSRQFLLGNKPYCRINSDIQSCLCVDASVGCSGEVVRAQHSKLYELGQQYRNFLMRLFHFNHDPVESPAPESPPSFEAEKRTIVERLENTEKTNTEIKKLALFRDGYRCLLSGVYDRDTIDKNLDFANQYFAWKVHRNSWTQCAYILPDTSQNGNKVSQFSRDSEFAPAMITSLERLDLLGGKVNHPANVLTMEQSLHDGFNSARLWLEPVADLLDTYDLVYSTTIKYGMVPLPDRVTVEVNPEMLKLCQEKGVPPPELPSPVLLGFRAACCRVLHMSGAADQIDLVLQDMEEVGVLAEDGSSAEFLLSAISCAIPID
ncbi:hypothetical protein BXZ70DRAFT_995927 [Cristinia sonorae]|uniref:HNH nuclease domain-containing protein n=1 Tax=Cristinia sonorae TaxID=1940300 RepID=A0A8K0UFC7_9AGAR|nr:hypothetical protein BXZ70DRAFT_995927 [Cristinia sonorae]